MAPKRKNGGGTGRRGPIDDVPPGARTKATERFTTPGGPPATPPGDRHAQGTPAGGTEVGGLAGRNFGTGTPDEAEAEGALGIGVGRPDEIVGGPPYSGHAGGAVGGTPAEDRATGGDVRENIQPGGIKPGGVHRGDSTIGTDPNSGTD